MDEKERRRPEREQVSKWGGQERTVQQKGNTNNTHKLVSSRATQCALNCGEFNTHFR